LDLHVADGEFLVLVGPSGCGKSTTLRMIAGLESVTEGTIRIGSRVVNDVPPRERDIAMVFQNYALYPHMTVYENLAFALRLRGQPRSTIDARVRQAAALLGVEALLDRRPRELSGGQQQRVALGRAIVRQPQVFLLDEPLSNLDAALRAQMRRELAALRRRLGITTIYVTHDQVEAMTLGDRIVLMLDGRVQQVGAPTAVYQRPANLFAAAFLGSPPMNLVPGRLERQGGPWFVSKDGSFRLAVRSEETPPPAEGRAIVLGLRSEALVECEGPGGFQAVVEEIQPLGPDCLLTVRAGGFAITLRAKTGAARIGEVHRWDVAPGGYHWFDEASGERL